MKITLREDLHPDPEFYYQVQFRIYHKPYLIWDRGTWNDVIETCDTYRIEVDGIYAGEIILEHRENGAVYIVDFSLLPEYQGKGIGRAVLGELQKERRKITAVTRKDTLDFFLKCGFSLKKKMKNYYERGVDGYLIAFSKV
jgi:ribosomal protein S18 acetylase RimI-like enzyme